MSLDVYLKVDEPLVHRGTGVFIRDGGKTKELTPDEVLDRWPDADVSYSQTVSDVAYTANITHNLNSMAEAAGIYKELWRPDELGLTKAKELIAPLEAGFIKLVTKPENFTKYNPENGWGTYDGLVEFVKNYLVACQTYPESRIEVSR